MISGFSNEFSISKNNINPQHILLNHGKYHINVIRIFLTAGPTVKKNSNDITMTFLQTVLTTNTRHTARTVPFGSHCVTYVKKQPG